MFDGQSKKKHLRNFNRQNKICIIKWNNLNITLRLTYFSLGYFNPYSKINRGDVGISQ